MANEYVIKNGLIVGDLTYPATDGSSGDVFTTDGSGNITLQAPGGGTSGGGTLERVFIQWDSSFDVDTVTDETSGVTTTVVNATNSDFSFAFSGHSQPPINILIWVENRELQEWTPNTLFQLQNQAGTAILGGTGTEFGSFDGPITMSMNENILVGLANNPGLPPDPPRTYVFFYFAD
jgi:hypothetical protein